MATNHEDVSDHLINLIINQDHVCAGWIKFLMTIQAGLLLGFQFVLSKQPQGIYSIGYYAIPALGIIVTFSVLKVILRERRWQAWYVNKYNAVPENYGKIFPREDESLYGQSVPDDNESIPAPRNMGYVARQMTMLSIAVIAIWIVIMTYEALIALGYVKG